MTFTLHYYLLHYYKPLVSYYNKIQQALSVILLQQNIQQAVSVMLQHNVQHTLSGFIRPKNKINLPFPL